MLKTSDFDYYLPAELIAQNPADKRDSSRLLVLNRKTGSIKHKQFSQITEYLKQEDLLVLNNTKVIPARLNGSKYGGGARIEVLLDRRIDDSTWEALARPAKRLGIGDVVGFGDGFYGEVKARLDNGKLIFYFASVEGFEKALRKHGRIPLPPYIKPPTSNTQLQNFSKRYQTVYAGKPGATAAPTAGLHFTKELLDKIKARKTYITLHTGYGTFAPVRVQNIEEHRMHSESYEISDKAIRDVKTVKANKGRVIAVGTTSVRLLESFDKAGAGETEIFIYPGHNFKVVDAMITNFHLPRSTLIMLVSAFAGIELIKKAYSEAIKERYRFFSFGDAMLIL